MQITTFYSYKGGLGRSLLLAWSARRLAAAGHTVVAIDLDLEAPGLPFKFGIPVDDELGPGMVGLVSRFKRGVAPPDDFRSWFRPVTGQDRLWLLPAGQFASADYWRDLAQIDWHDLFFGPRPHGVHFFLWLRDAIEKEFQTEHLLIDARTGVTEIGGAALAILADQVVTLVGTSPEGIHGTRAVLRSVMDAPRLPGRPAPRIGLVLSRMPASMLGSELQSLRRAVRDEICAEADPRTATVHSELPLVVRSESVLHQDERRALDTGSLRVHADYETVVAWIRGAAVPTEVTGVVQDDADSTAALQQSIELQRRLADRNPREYLPELAETLGSLSRRLQDHGRSDEAIAVAQEAVDLQRRLATDGTTHRLDALADSEARFAELLRLGGMFSEARAALEAAIATQRRVVAQASPAREHAHALLLLLVQLGDLLVASGDRAAAEPAYAEALSIADREAPGDREAARYLSAVHDRIGRLHQARGAIDDALHHFGRSAELARQVSETADASAADVRELSIACGNLGDGLVGAGQVDRAIVEYERGVAAARQAAALDTAHRRDLSVLLNKLGDAMFLRGDAAAAEATYTQAIAIRDELARAGPSRVDSARDLAAALHRRARVHVTQQAVAEAVGDLERSATILSGIQADPAILVDVERELATTCSDLGDAHLALQRFDQARAAYASALDLRERIAHANRDRPDSMLGIAAARVKLGDLERLAGDDARARHHYAAAIELRAAVVGAAPDQAQLHAELATVLERLAMVTPGPDRRAHWDRAIASRRTIVRLMRDESPALWQLAVTLRRYGEVTGSNTAIAEADHLARRLADRPAAHPDPSQDHRSEG